jgi:hypothetical protein
MATASPQPAFAGDPGRFVHERERLCRSSQALQSASGDVGAHGVPVRR